MDEKAKLSKGRIEEPIPGRGYTIVTERSDGSTEGEGGAQIREEGDGVTVTPAKKEDLVKGEVLSPYGL